MQYELEVLDDLVFEHLDPKIIFARKPDTARLQEYNDLIKTGKESAARKIRKYMRRLSSENQKEAYIQLQQTGITQLLDVIIDYLMPKDIFNIKPTKEITIGNTYINVFLALDELLNTIKDGYPNYFNNAGKMADIYKWRAAIDIDRNAKSIKKYLQQQNAPAAFTELIIEPFDNFIAMENSFSYREFYYIEEFQKNILDIIKLKADNGVEQITERLFYLNFNSVLFYNYYILQLKEQASERKSVTDLVDFYSWQIKILNQRIVKPNCVYLAHLESLRDQLVFWIAEDLHYLNKKHQLTLALPVGREVAKEKAKKVHVTLTVPDLALGARLLLDDVIINSNYTELMERVAKNFRTNRRESLSNNNTYNEGFNISVVTKEKMKSLLLKLSRKVAEF